MFLSPRHVAEELRDCLTTPLLRWYLRQSQRFRNIFTPLAHSQHFLNIFLSDYTVGTLSRPKLPRHLGLRTYYITRALTLHSINLWSLTILAPLLLLPSEKAILTALTYSSGRFERFKCDIILIPHYFYHSLCEESNYTRHPTCINFSPRANFGYATILSVRQFCLCANFACAPILSTREFYRRANSILAAFLYTRQFYLRAKFYTCVNWNH